MTAAIDLRDRQPGGHRTGDTVVIAARGDWFGHSGTITGIRASDHTDLYRYRVSGAGGWWYADELAPQPHTNPEHLVPDGPARHVIRAARMAGWVVHVTPEHQLALISGPGTDGTYLRVWAERLGWEMGWDTAVEKFDSHARPFDRRNYLTTTDQLVAVITGHGQQDNGDTEGLV